jgi:hypothetical protein
VLCIWCGLIPSAWAFGWCLFLTVELSTDEIHPDDFDSARLWRDFWWPIFATFPPLLGTAYTFIFISFISIMSLKVDPTLTTVTAIQAVTGSVGLIIFCLGFPWFAWRRGTLKQQLHEEREAAQKQVEARRSKQKQAASSRSAPSVDVGARRDPPPPARARGS